VGGTNGDGELTVPRHSERRTVGSSIELKPRHRSRSTALQCLLRVQHDAAPEVRLAVFRGPLVLVPIRRLLETRPPVLRENTLGDAIGCDRQRRHRLKTGLPFRRRCAYTAKASLAHPVGQRERGLVDRDEHRLCRTPPCCRAVMASGNGRRLDRLVLDETERRLSVRRRPHHLRDLSRRALDQRRSHQHQASRSTEISKVRLAELLCRPLKTRLHAPANKPPTTECPPTQKCDQWAAGTAPRKPVACGD